MNILKDVLSALFSMFFPDARLTGAILATFVVAALLIDLIRLPNLVGGTILLVGCIAVLFLSVMRKAARRERSS